MRYLKGLIGLIIVMILALTYLATLISLHIASTTYSIKTTSKSDRILKAADQIEAIKIGIRFLLNYSFLQGLYETARHGIFVENYEDIFGVPAEFEEYPILRLYSATYLEDVLKVISKIRKTTNDVIKKYLKELKNKYEIKMEIGEFILKEDGNKHEIEASLDIEYQTDYFLIKDFVKERIDVTKHMATFLNLFSYVKNKFVDNDILSSAISNALGMIPENCSSISVEICEDEYYSLDFEKASNILFNYCPDIIEYLNTSISNKLFSSLQTNFLDFSFFITNISLNYTYSAEKKEEKEDLNRECREGSKKVLVEIKYNYSAEVTALFNITSRDVYPLYEKKEKVTQLRPLTFSFSVISRS